jgi:hypothetical protein
VGGKSFIFFRNPRPDAVDAVTRERYGDVIVFWVPSEAEKQALVQDDASPFFTTPHFDGHLSVLVRASRLSLTRQELAEIVQEAWLSRASARRAAAWLTDTRRRDHHVAPNTGRPDRSSAPWLAWQTCPITIARPAGSRATYSTGRWPS